MTYYKYWTIIIFAITVPTILIDRRHPVVLPVLLKTHDSWYFLWHLPMIQHIWGRFFQLNVSTQYIIIVIRSRSKICFNIFIRNVKQEINNFEKKNFNEILKFGIHLVASIGKIIIKFIWRKVTSDSQIVSFYGVVVIIFYNNILFVSFLQSYWMSLK